MTASKTAPTVALLALPEVTASTLYGMYDLFAAAGRDWEFVISGTPGEPTIRPQVVASTRDSLRAINGVQITPDATLAECPRADVACVPELFVAPNEPLAGRYAAEIQWLREQYAAGAMLASACSGALLLAETGLLDGLDATTHWGYCDALARSHPQVKVRKQRALVASGEGQRIVMAGGGTSWQDLALFLIARLVGVDEAMHVARVYLIDWHHIGQQPFARLARSRQVEDAIIARSQVWIAEHYNEPNPVTALVRLSGLAERSFKRRFQKATGMAPLEYVHTLRIEEAKQMLEGGEDPIEAIAHEVGYEDAAFFSRLFRRVVYLSPAQYRKRFGALRQTLCTARM
ncbi:MAG: helix-turn-helix domain-containing protein [Betaproteobacteria bacterium]|nr:helix-turn-helix domain-containing protein [Betaproteobacteria bacterium]